MNLSNQCLKPCMLVASTTSCGWVVGLKHILCGKKHLFLFAFKLSACLISCLACSFLYWKRQCKQESTLFCVTSGLMTFSFIYHPLLVTFPESFQKEVTLPLSLSLLSVARFSGVFLSADSDAGFQGTGLGYNNQDQLQYFTTCHPVNWHDILVFIL